MAAECDLRVHTTVTDSPRSRLLGAENVIGERLYGFGVGLSIVNTLAQTTTLIVTERAKLAATLADCLAPEGAFTVSAARDMDSGLIKAQTEWPALILLALREPERMLEFCRILKSDRGTRGITIIILADASEVDDRIAGLEAGADDYLGTQTHAREIILRIKAILRRANLNVAEEQFVRGPIRVNSTRCDVAVDGRPVHLTAVEFKLLYALVKQPGSVKSRSALQGEAGGDAEVSESRSVDTHIRRLRQKLGRAAYLVETVRGSGYRLRVV